MGYINVTEGASQRVGNVLGLCSEFSEFGFAWESKRTQTKQRTLTIGMDKRLAREASLSDQNIEPKTRNPKWSRDELILALHLYLTHRRSPPGKHSKQVAEVSRLLSDMGKALGLANEGTYRNANGVYMKMMNFRRFDPEYTQDGKTGLARGNKDEAVVWREFADDTTRLAAVCTAIRSAVAVHVNTVELNGGDVPGITEAEEGRTLTRLHTVRERSRKLVQQAKATALKKHGRLFCQACGFDFKAKYGERGDGLIEVHHTKPVHTLVEGEKTHIDDLALLCANCHRVVHSSRRWLSVDEVSSLIQKHRA